jgi:hypothetical protein
MSLKPEITLKKDAYVLPALNRYKIDFLIARITFIVSFQGPQQVHTASAKVEEFHR